MYPFKRDRLFGNCLYKILVKTKHKEGAGEDRETYGLMNVWRPLLKMTCQDSNKRRLKWNELKPFRHAS